MQITAKPAGQTEHALLPAAPTAPKSVVPGGASDSPDKVQLSSQGRELASKAQAADGAKPKPAGSPREALEAPKAEQGADSDDAGAAETKATEQQAPVREAGRAQAASAVARQRIDLVA